MTDEQKKRISQLRESGFSYKQISDELGISKNTVSTFCRRNGLAGAPEDMAAPGTGYNPSGKICLQCGTPVPQTPGRKEKKFCSGQCRNRWWNTHLSQAKRKSMNVLTCPSCGKTFYAYGNRNRKYCSHKCYIKGRFGGTEYG